MNKKVLGASLRRGVLTGTVAGFVAGWSAFVGHGKELDAMQADAQLEVRQKRADLVLPPVPAMPDLPAMPGAQTYRLRYGPAEPLPRVTVPNGPASTATATPIAPRSAATVAPAPVLVPAAPPAPAPTFAPLPTLPPAPVVPAPTTRTSPPRK
jgi:hypothetical protein